MLTELPLALVDLETTGASAKHDRIMEVAVVCRGGDKVEPPWQSLVNPLSPVPAFIQGLTGIGNDDLAQAPQFGELAEVLWQHLAERVLVAHNARFDLAFLKREFAALGYDYRPKVLCTLKLARALYPQWPRHGLEAICGFIDYRSERHHRAMADVLAMQAFLDYAIADLGEATVAYHIALQLQLPALPPYLPRSEIDAIPNCPGVYRFYGEAGELLYIGKSVRLRSRVLSHFSADQHGGKAMKLAQQLRRIEWSQTAGEMGALLQESREIKQCMPIYNQRLRRRRSLCSVTVAPDSEGYHRLQFHSGLPGRALAEGRDFAVFKTRKQAREYMAAVAAEVGLCPQRLGLEKGAASRRPCFAHQLQRCRGACQGLDPVVDYNRRLQEVLASHTVVAWPYGEPVVIREAGEDGRIEWHVVDRWVHLGVVPEGQLSRDACAGLLAEDIDREFDYDSYRILRKFADELQWTPLSELT